VSLPGFVLAALAWFTIREPRRAKSPIENAGVSAGPSGPLPDSASSTLQPSLKEVFVTLWANATFRHLLHSFSVFYFFAYGIGQWQPAFFVRSFGLTTGELGTWFAVVYGVGGLVGTYWGGVWASRYAPNNERLQLRVMAIANAVFNAVIWALIYFSHNYHVAFAWMALSTLGGMTILGPMYAMTQTLVPARMRAMAIAIVLLFANLIGMGLGPLAVGVVSDALQPLWGQESLRYALLAFSPGYLWVSWHLWQASKTVARDLEAIREDGNGDIRESEGAVNATAKTCVAS
jgi:MFS family permease